MNILITGASSGIGRALALQYATQQVTLVLLSRNAEALQDTARLCQQKGASIDIHVIDITTPAYLPLLETLSKQYRFQLVFANAGASLLETFQHPTQNQVSSITTLMNLNFTAQVHTAFGLFNSLKATQGHIIFTNSLAALRGLPQDPAYSASKSALSTFFEGIRPLWKRQGVQVSMVYAGFITTPMSDKLTTPKPFCMTAEKAARIIARQASQKKVNIFLPWQQYWLFRLGQCLPNQWLDWILNHYM